MLYVCVDKKANTFGALVLFSLNKMIFLCKLWSKVWIFYYIFGGSVITTIAHVVNGFYPLICLKIELWLKNYET